MRTISIMMRIISENKMCFACVCSQPGLSPVWVVLWLRIWAGIGVELAGLAPMAQGESEKEQLRRGQEFFCSKVCSADWSEESRRK